jgi:hypothetical protein
VTVFSSNQTSFGRHETFPLRYSWLTKGFSAWCENPNLFDQEDATVTLGVGKNMVTAIRYWMLAAQAVTVEGRSLKPTVLGKSVFSLPGWDPYLEDDTTIWLIHWLIASNPSWATTPFWFFNRFHKPEFTSKELHDALTDFITEELSARISTSTIKHDAALLLRMYERTTESKAFPIEEALDSPLSMLGLLKHPEGSRFHESKPDLRAKLPIAAFGYSVSELFDQLAATSMPIERLLHSDGTTASPGSVFRLTEEGLIAKLEAMVAWLPGTYELRETAGVHQLYRLTGIAPMELLRMHYEGVAGRKQ